jgi:hypothetical protein
MHRTKLFALGLGVFAAGLVACQGNDATSPAPSRRSLLVADDLVVTTLLINPATSNTFSIGGVHKLKVPSGAVCDPLTSSYGPGTWDLPCAPAVAPIVVTATSWTDSSGHPFISFQPALRFRATDHGSVTIYMKDKDGVIDPSDRILYCPDDVPGAGCVDEALTDSTLNTHVERNGTTLSRVIKHFSGYNIASGRSTVEME